MADLWTCPVCGGSGYHYSNSRNSLVCDTCGSQVRFDEDRREDLSYQRNMGLARQHIQVGNWEEAKRLITPYCSSRPTDRQIYQLLLIACTKNYTDLLLDDPYKRKEAAGYWDKLQRLGYSDSNMRNYANNRINKVKGVVDSSVYNNVTVTAISVILTIITIILFGAGSKDSIMFFIITIISWVITNKKKENTPSKSFTKDNLSGFRDDNPFIYTYH